MMLSKIMDVLNRRSDLAGWTVRHLITEGTQVYAVPRQTEAQRTIGIEQYKIDVLRQTSTPDGKEAVGSGNATVLAGGDIEAAVERAVLMAGLVANPVHSIPGPSPIPDVPLVDPELKHNTPAVTRTLMERMQAAASRNAEVQLTGAECFGEIHSTRLVNSRGIDAEQESTALYLEFVLHSQRDGQDRETFTDIRRRRIADLDIEREIERRTRHTLEQFEAGPPPLWHGPVVIRGETLATFMAGDSLGGGVIQTLGSAESKYAKFSPWEIGKSVLRKDARGDPLTVWANRCLPYGTHSNRFDEEGLPAQRVELIRENQLVAFTASQRYAEYLDFPATGAFGAVEVAPGSAPASALLEEPYVEVVQFSWFNPDGITGDFATEIRFGYVVENGVPKPFRGGQLVGNFLDALAHVRWSKETSMYGKYSGPEIARFNSLRIAG